MLIDIGVNLTGSSFIDDLDQVVKSAVDVGVEKMLVTGTDVLHSQAALSLAQRYPGILFATAGIHPHHASECQRADINRIHELAQAPEVVAMGECGLDYNRNYSSPDAQRSCFEQQLQLAVDVQKPVFLHQRDAHEDYVQLLKKYLNNIPSAVAHCFTGTEQQLHEYLDMGLYIGITGWICDERRGQALKSMVKQIPLNRLMLETDAPYLLPRDLPEKPKSRRNEPRYLPHICESVAQCYGVSTDVIAAHSSRNASDCFGI